MAGERLHPPGWTEISAVCTDSNYRGQGLATRLVRAVEAGIKARGETPFLHAAATNTNAIRLYEQLGFATSGHVPGPRRARRSWRMSDRTNPARSTNAVAGAQRAEEEVVSLARYLIRIDTTNTGDPATLGRRTDRSRVRSRPVDQARLRRHPTWIPAPRAVATSSPAWKGATHLAVRCWSTDTSTSAATAPYPNGTSSSHSWPTKKPAASRDRDGWWSTAGTCSTVPPRP